MSKYLKKLMIVPILMMSLGFVSCGENKQIESDGLLNYYMGFNKENKFQKVNEDLKEMDNFTVLNESESWVIDEYNDITAEANVIKIVNNDENIGDEIKISYWKEDGKFKSLEYIKEEKALVENNKGLYVKSYDYIMDTDEVELKVLDKDSQKAFINIGEFDTRRIDYINTVIFDEIIPNISYKKGDYDKNLKLAKECTKGDAELTATQGVDEDDLKFIDIENNWDDQELLRMLFDKNGTIISVAYIVNEEKNVGIKNEDDGKSQLYATNSGKNGELELKNGLQDLRQYINSVE